MLLLRLAFAATIFFAPASQAADGFLHENLRIPMPGTPHGLEALLIRPDAAGRYPVALINHGSPRKPEDRPNISPRQFIPHAMEFARRGFAAVILIRRGYGATGGEYAETNGPCNNPDFQKSAVVSAQDLRAALVHLAKRSDVDAARMISIGQSAGGLATVGLTADPPSSLVAAINFAGGRGSRAEDDVCQEDRLVDAFRALGKRSRIPMLWVYTENDHFFRPALAEKFRQAFTAGGGVVAFIKAPAFGEDGHSFFARAIPQWTPMVDAFLKQRNLMPRERPLALPSSKLTAPPQLSERGRIAVDTYRTAIPHKAFAISTNGSFGWRGNRESVDQAKREAIETCDKVAKGCRLIFVDDDPLP